MFTSLANEKHKELLLPIETLRADFLRMFLQNLGSEIAPVCAFLGGALAQDVINVLGQREQPLQNMLLFDGETFEAPVYALHPPPDLMAMSTYARAAAMPVHGIVNGDLNGSKWHGQQWGPGLTRRKVLNRSRMIEAATCTIHKDGKQIDDFRIKRRLMILMIPRATERLCGSLDTQFG